MLLSLLATMHVSGNQEAEVTGSPFTVTPNNSLVEFLFPIANILSSVHLEVLIPKEKNTFTEDTSVVLLN